MAHVEDPGPDAEPRVAGPAGDVPARPAESDRATISEHGDPRRGALSRSTIEALQRSVGNRATVALLRGRATLARFTEKNYAGLDPVAAVRKALADDKTADSLELMRRLENAEQANQVLKSFQKLATGTFGNESMATAAEILVSKGGSLNKALDWMVDEGYDFKRMRKVISLGTDAERLNMKGDAWMRYWVGQLGNDDMAELVKMLPLDLPTKLRWMKEEGSDWGLMKSVILSVPPPARTTVVEFDDLRGFFVKECNDEEMYEAVKLLGGPLRKQLAWMAAEDCEDAWIKERVDTIKDASQRRGVYYEKSAQLRILKMSDRDRAALATELGGTPDEQLSLFQNDVPISLLTWASPPSKQWVDACLKYRKNPRDLLWLASGSPALWGPLIRPRLWDLLGTYNDVIYPDFRVNVFWEAYGDGLAFNASQIMHFIALLTGKTPVPAGKKIAGDNYLTVAPNDDTARAFMELLKPGGSSGASGIPRDQLAQGTVAFASKRWDAGNSQWIPIGTSYFYRGYIVIAVTDAGVRDTSNISSAGGTPLAVGTGMTMFENHARHEIGHAVGERKIGQMQEKGNDFALDWGGWKKSKKADFERALWADQVKPAAGWPTVVIAGTNVTLTNKDVHDWCMGLLAPGAKSQVNNAIGQAPGNVQQKITAIKGSLWSGVKLVDYLKAINDLLSGWSGGPGGVTVSDMRDNAYMFPGYDPPDPVPIVSTRWDDDYVTYKKDAYRELKPISWYALSSPAEMFAEMYTARYARKTLPGRVGTRDPAVFFGTLEAQHDPMFGK